MRFLDNPAMMQLEGIYRISGNSESVRNAWAAFCCGHFDYVEWQHEAGELAHLVTGALKLYLRELETPLLPFDLHQRFLDCETGMGSDAAAKLATMAQLIQELNAVSQHTLKRLMYHLNDVAHYEKVSLFVWMRVVGQITQCFLFFE